MKNYISEKQKIQNFGPFKNNGKHIFNVSEQKNNSLENKNNKNEYNFSISKLRSQINSNLLNLNNSNSNRNVNFSNGSLIKSLGNISNKHLKNYISDNNDENQDHLFTPNLLQNCNKQFVDNFSKFKIVHSTTAEGFK